MEIKRFDIFLINFDPTIGHEIKKTRPCLIISPDEMNKYLSTVIVAPMTTKKRNYPTRINCVCQNKQAQIVLDQIRTIDKKRLITKIDEIDKKIQIKVIEILQEMFSF